MENKKAAIRKEALQRRKQLTAQERKQASLVLTERILGHQWYYLSDSILGFVPYGSEIDIRELLSEAFKKGKKVYLPKVLGEEMQFFAVNSLEELEVGYKGILEPAGNTECYPYDEAVAGKTIMLMPGVAFDKMRNRIGYGKGYYDRFLRDKEALQLRTVAVGFRCQLMEEIPAEPFDIRPYQVICI